LHLEAFAAFDSFGTNAAPFLIKRLQLEDTRLRQKATAFGLRIGLRRAPFRSAELERAQAVAALSRLKSLPPDVSLKLTNLSTHPSPAVARSALYVLQARGGHVATIEW
jgi:hypothetical protein